MSYNKYYKASGYVMVIWICFSLFTYRQAKQGPFLSLSEVSDTLKEVLLQYKAVLGPQGSAIELEDKQENESDFSSPDTSENEEEECR